MMHPGFRGHGHVTPRPDGYKARCGGPVICPVCQREAALIANPQQQPPKAYVVGFLFDHSRTLVALVRKNRPRWQAGKFNGIGGKVEPGETAYDAMVREFREEAGPTITGWDHFASISGPEIRVDGGGGYRVDFFRASMSDIAMNQTLLTMTDESIVVVRVDSVTIENAVPNLRWLLPMAVAIDADTTGRFDIVEVPA